MLKLLESYEVLAALIVNVRPDNLLPIFVEYLADVFDLVNLVGIDDEEGELDGYQESKVEGQGERRLAVHVAGLRGAGSVEAGAYVSCLGLGIVSSLLLLKFAGVIVLDQAPNFYEDWIKADGDEHLGDYLVPLDLPRPP